MTYFNENDPYPAAWLRNLYPEAQVDDRSILDLVPSDVMPHTRAHFFAGIGVWEYALELAGWPAATPVWTGSCPCQPFSEAGRQLGGRDPRHLWPVWYDLIRLCRPPTIFGEQVASRRGRDWLARVRADLEILGYAVGAADLSAAGAGAPHIRQRLYWVAHTDSPGCGADGLLASQDGHAPRRDDAHRGGAPLAMADAGRARLQGFTGDAGQGSDQGHRPDRAGAPGALADALGGGRRRGPHLEGPGSEGRAAPQWSGEAGIVADAGGERVRGSGRGADPGAAAEAEGHRGERQRLWPDTGPGGAHLLGLADANGGESSDRGVQRGGEHGFLEEDLGLSWATWAWSEYEILPCRDGKFRRTQPGIFPLADGAAFKVGSGSSYEGKSRVGMLRAYGNAIVPQVAAQFIRAYLEATMENSSLENRNS